MILNNCCRNVILSINGTFGILSTSLSIECSRGEYYEISLENHVSHTAARDALIFRIRVRAAFAGLRGDMLSGTICRRCDGAGWHAICFQYRIRQDLATEEYWDLRVEHQ